MYVEKIHIEDIRGVGHNGTLSLDFPDYAKLKAASQLVYHVNLYYPREDGYRYSTKTEVDQEKGQFHLEIQLTKKQ